MTNGERYQIKVTQVFNGEVAGHGEGIFDVAFAAGPVDSVEAIVRRYEGAGDGWGVQLAVAHVDVAKALGGYESDYGWLLPLPGRDPVPLSIDPV